MEIIHQRCLGNMNALYCHIYLIIVDSRQISGRLFNILSSESDPSYNAIVNRESVHVHLL